MVIVRHEPHAADRLVLRLWGEDCSSTGTCYATVEALGEQIVVLEEGQTACEVPLKGPGTWSFAAAVLRLKDQRSCRCAESSASRSCT